MDNCKTPPIRTPTANAVIGSAKLRNAMAEKRFGAFFYVSDFNFLVKEEE